jgi:hypothetical protein
LALRLRIPAWANDGSTLRINGQPTTLQVRNGFATIQRVWRTSDVVELNLPMSLRLEPLPANGGPNHSETVALLRGPLVLFPLRTPGDAGPIQISPDALLQAERTGPREWRAANRIFTPFTDLGNSEYSTYMTLI